MSRICVPATPCRLVEKWLESFLAEKGPGGAGGPTAEREPMCAQVMTSWPMSRIV